MIIYNTLSTLIFWSPGISSVQNCDNLFFSDNVTTSANVPPQGWKNPGSTVIKCKWRLRSLYEGKLIHPPAFEVQMVRRFIPNDTMLSHLHQKSKVTTPHQNDTLVMA